jgi:hypothetical protein
LGCTSRQELLMAQVLEIHQLLSSLRSSELQLVLDLVHPTTRFCIQISGQLRVQVLQLLAMKQLACTSHLERQLVKELAVQVPQSFIAIFVPQVHPVARQLETKQLACTQLQETQLVLALEQRARMNSRFFTEHLYLLEHQVKQQLVCTLHQELLLVLVLPQLEILQLDFIQHQELQPAMEQAVQAIQLSKAIFVQQVLLAVRLQAIQQPVFILHQEPQMEMELEIRRHQSSQHLSEPHLVLVLGIQTTPSCTQTSGQLWVLVPLLQAIPQLVCIQRRELQPAKERAVKVPQVFTAISVRQQHLVELQLEMKQQVCTLHREMQVEMELVLHQ